jgi:arylsulfatase A-like enzyme
MRRHVWLLPVLVLVGCVAQPQPTLRPAPAGPRPNLLFITTDDQRFDMLGVVHPFLETPNMDRLAAAGVRFENAFVTTPICAASRASLLTGLVERTHRYTFGTPPLADRLADQSYPVLLREAGYDTGFVGKFGVNTEPGATAAMFDTYVPQWAPYLVEQEDGSRLHLTDIAADTAIDFLRASDPMRPFALTLSFNAPHADDGDERQYVWPEAMDGMYSDVDIPAPPLSEPTFFDALPEFLKEASLNRIRWFWRFDTPEKAQQMTRGYLRMISGVDAAVGRVLGELEDLGLASNTVVILMGDNGYFLGERGYAGKWLPYELSIRVPLIVYDPRIEGDVRGSVPSQPVLNIDIAPTLLDLAGVDIPTTMQGASLLPILEGASPVQWRSDFFVEHLMEHESIARHEGVRGEQYKYARYFEQEPVYEELYDLLADPMETTNLAGDPDYHEILAELRRRTDELQVEYVAARVGRRRQPAERSEDGDGQ